MTERDRITQAIDNFPAEFGLRSFPGKIFQINERNSYVSDGTVILYTDILTPNGWTCFAKGTEAELRSQATRIETQ